MGWTGSPAGGGGGSAPLLHVRDEKPNLTNGGASASQAWQTRTLNTIKTNEITGASLAANVLTLPAGTYEVDASAPAYRVAHHRIRLYNVTASATLLVGQSAYDLGDQVGRATMRGRFTLASTSDVRLDHFTYTAVANNGLGATAQSGDVEVFSDMTIRKIS